MKAADAFFGVLSGAFAQGIVSSSKVFDASFAYIAKRNRQTWKKAGLCSGSSPYSFLWGGEL